MKSPRRISALNHGFTLLEVMLVIVLIGIMASAIQFNIVDQKPEKMLQQTSARFAGIFDIAAEYALLNNVELGLLIEKENYQFLAYDGTRWSVLPDQDMLTTVTLPDGIEMKLSFDDLPIEEPLLFDSLTFSDAEEDKEFDPSEEEKLIPQVYILSGGDITPFSLTFFFEDEQLLDKNIAYRITGVYSTPLTIEEIILDE